MKGIDETSAFIDAENGATEEKEVQNTTDLLNSVKEVFGNLTAAMKDLEAVMTALQLNNTEQPASEEPAVEDEKESE